MTAAAALAPLLSSKRTDWNTPKELLDVVRMLGPISLDPCSNAESIVGAETEWRGGGLADGLKVTWEGYRLVYVNPPYGRAIHHWIAKCVAESYRQTPPEIVALLPARTDTRWFQDAMISAASVCFWRGRLTFLGAQDPAPFPSAIVYWGRDPSRFEAAFSRHGWCVRPR